MEAGRVSGAVEGEAGTVEAAVADACARAGLKPSEVLVTVLSEGSPAAPGERLAASRARVRVEPIPDEGVRGRDNLVELLRLMEIEAEVKVSSLPAEPTPASVGSSPPLVLTVEGADLGILIGWRGESLRALQTVVNLMLGPGDGGHSAPRLIVDVAGYRQRREHAVAEMARRLAAGVTRTGRPVTLDPMQPYERRAAHLALADDPGVVTESSGSGAERRLTIRPAAPAAGAGYPPGRREDPARGSWS